MDNNDKNRNNVAATGQVPTGNYRYFGSESGHRVLFAGNSITLHGPAPHLGWYGDWGMAASAREKDFVHLVAAELGDPYCCVCNCADYERGFMNDSSIGVLDEAREFGAETVVIRLGDNVEKSNAEKYDLKAAVVRMIKYVGEKAKRVIVTDLFWKCEEIDSAFREAAKECGVTFVSICDLGFIDEMKAVKEFEHKGVGLHPSDRGMAAIADRILAALKSTPTPTLNR